MAKTREQIKAEMRAELAADDVLSVELTSDSNAADHNLWIDLVSFFIYYLSGVYDVFVSVVNGIIAKQKPHTKQWYVEKVKAYQHGDELVADEDYYATINATTQVVKYAAAVEVTPHLRLKLAGDNGSGGLAPITGAQLDGVTEYMSRVKDAGVRLQVTSGIADSLKCAYTIYYDPLVLAADGSRLDGTNANPVLAAVKAYIKSLDFNGLFITNRMTDMVEAVEGVKIGVPLYVQSRYGALEYADVGAQVRPDAGYLALVEDDFVANTVFVPEL